MAIDKSNYTVTNSSFNGSDLDNILVPRSLINESTVRWRWGGGFNGYPGDNTGVTRSSPVKTAILLSGWTSISGTAFHGTGIRTDGNIWSWGLNGDGALGDGTTVNKSSPVTILAPAGLTAWRTVAAGAGKSYMITDQGQLWCVGNNDNGSLGDNSTVKKSSPVTVSGGGFDWRFISSKGNSAGGIKADGSAWVWGRAFTGDGTGTNRSSPVSVTGGLTWKVLNLGYSSHAGITTNDVLYTWGRNVTGQLGDGTTVSKSSPITVAGGGTWRNIANGGVGDVEGEYRLAIKTDGTLWSWGYNINGCLGDGTTVDRSSPGSVAGGGTNWKLVAGMQTFASSNSGRVCVSAIKTDGTVWSWGGGEFGVLGDGTTIPRSSPGSTLAPAQNWSHIVIGETWCHALAIDDFL